jgi:hypothetical protein
MQNADVAVSFLALLIKRVQETGLSTDLDDGIAIIQYVDGMIFMFEDSLESARNLNFILCIF